MPAPAPPGRLTSIIASLRSAPPVIRDLVVVELDKRDGNLYAWDQQHNAVIPISTGGGGGTPYVLPVATATVLGGIKQGPGFEVIGSGVLETDLRTLTVLP